MPRNKSNKVCPRILTQNLKKLLIEPQDLMCLPTLGARGGILVQGEHSSSSSFLNGKRLPATEEVLIYITQAAEQSPCSETSETPHKTINK